MKRWNWKHTLALIAIPLIVLGLWASRWLFVWPLTKDWLPNWLNLFKAAQSNLILWAMCASALVAFLFVVGDGITGRPLAFLIDARNRMSTSRLQISMWTVIVLSGWVAAVLWNLSSNSTTPLDIAMPVAVWELLGISTASLIGTPIILSGKTKSDAPAALVQTKAQDLIDQRTGSRQVGSNTAPPTSQTFSSTPASAIPSTAVDSTSGGTPAPSVPTPPVAGALSSQSKAPDIEVTGKLVSFGSIADASPADLFQGDEIGNAPNLDIGKVQMFIFTLVLALAYALGIGNVLVTATDKGITAFPDIDGGMIALLAISHAGYLGYKAAPHTPTDPGTK